MQLQFTSDELQLTVDLLEQRDHELRNEIVHTDHNDLKFRLNNEEKLLEELEDKLIGKNLQLSIDELDLLSSELSRCDRALIAEAARSTHLEFKRSLQEKETLLQHVRDKVIEACAMA